MFRHAIHNPGRQPSENVTRLTQPGTEYMDISLGNDADLACCSCSVPIQVPLGDSPGIKHAFVSVFMGQMIWEVRNEVETNTPRSLFVLDGIFAAVKKLKGHVPGQGRVCPYKRA